MDALSQQGSAPPTAGGGDELSQQSTAPPTAGGGDELSQQGSAPPTFGGGDAHQTAGGDDGLSQQGSAPPTFGGGDAHQTAGGDDGLSQQGSAPPTFGGGDGLSQQGSAPPTFGGGDAPPTFGGGDGLSQQGSAPPTFGGGDGLSQQGSAPPTAGGGDELSQQGSAPPTAGGGDELSQQSTAPPTAGGGDELSQQSTAPPTAGGGDELSRLSRQGSAPPTAGGGAAEKTPKFQCEQKEHLMFIKCEDEITIVIAGFSKAFTFAHAHFHWFALASGQTLVTSGDTVDPERNWTTQHQHYTYPGRTSWVETIDWDGARSEPLPFEPLALARYTELEESGRLTKWGELGTEGFLSMSKGDITYNGGCFWTCTGPGQVTQEGLEYSGGNIGTSNDKAVLKDCEVFTKRKIRISPLKVLYEHSDGTMVFAQFRTNGKHRYRLVNDSDQSSGSDKYGHLQSQVMVMSNKEYWTRDKITFRCEELAPGVFAIPHFAMVDSEYHDAISPETIASFIVNIDN